MMDHARLGNAAATTVLGFCEALILALTEIMSEQDARDVLMSVVTLHEEAAAISQTPELHLAVADVVRCILAGRNVMLH
jgi:hypothetical protein